VAAKLKDDGSDSENEEDCDEGGVRVNEADAHVPPEDFAYGIRKADREEKEAKG
jgi:hypothetical protein